MKTPFSPHKFARTRKSTHNVPLPHQVPGNTNDNFTKALPPPQIVKPHNLCHTSQNQLQSAPTQTPLNPILSAAAYLKDNPTSHPLCRTHRLTRKESR